MKKVTRSTQQIYARISIKFANTGRQKEGKGEKVKKRNSHATGTSINVVTQIETSRQTRRQLGVGRAQGGD
jgi:hypothetical protein